jgi:protein-S-isoprenylcysteine O-methyltransferase Ste14
MANERRVTVLQLVLTVPYLLIWPAAMFWLAGDWRWVPCWIFSAWFVLLSASCVAYLWLKDPALLAERYRKPGSGGQQGWDTYVVYMLLALFIVWIVIMPLDAKRFHWSPPWPLWLAAVGCGMLLLSGWFLFRSYSDNTYLSPLVRVQAERKHTVVSTGVYGFVRHPMYLGAILLFLGAPLLLGSLAGLGVGALACGVLAARITGEEELLLRELDGYAQYRERVRYRLIPRVW